ncbi:hypothetical protein BZM27_37965 [Paraburkholderia steynii]|uniref:Uncharacterized protein n=1 Tax=Paraburkholderia steynii TaxID=1245441 RepID=A0A4R0X7I7_9BURK|nr:hypothetical protein BZM27_37965 [Paraburkholderia steynii]
MVSACLGANKISDTLLVVFDREHVIAPTFHDLLGDRRLASDRVDCDHSSPSANMGSSALIASISRRRASSPSPPRTPTKMRRLQATRG